MKKLDLFPKVDRGAGKRTILNGVITVTTILLTFLLIVSECHGYFYPPVADHIAVDASLDGTVDINFGIYFMALSCDELHVDSVSADPLVTASKHVNYAKGNAWAYDTEATGCSAWGYARVSKSKGNIHIAAGRGVEQNHGNHQHHVHMINLNELRKGYNVSHQIYYFRFGWKEDAYSLGYQTLQGNKVALDNYAQIQYSLQVVGFVEDGILGRSESYGYSANVHSIPIDLSQKRFPLPGLFFKFDFSPFVIEHQPFGPSLIRVFLRLISLIGICHFLLAGVGRSAVAVVNYAKDKFD